jgi:hypothetical protein
MMEYWNSGIMGFGLRIVEPTLRPVSPTGWKAGSERIMPCWVNGPATDGIDDKIKMAYILLETNIPAFHHSIIPFRGKFKSQKKHLYYQ